MYVKLLDEVTKEISGVKTKVQKEIKMELTLDAYISEDYMPLQEERIVFYDRISKVATQAEFESVQKQMKDAFGELPDEVKNLCKIAYLKNLASQFNVQKIKVNNVDCLLYFYKSEQIIDQRLSNVGKFYDTCLKFEELPILKVNFKGKVGQKVDLLIEMLTNALSCKKD